MHDKGSVGYFSEIICGKNVKKGVSYTKITKETGASAATISRVSKCCEYGMGGYDIVISRCEGEKDA